MGYGYDPEETTGPVSYTHLDVYKRQAFILSWKVETTGILRSSLWITEAMNKTVQELNGCATC